MKKKYDTIVYIGRFQPLHNIHTQIIKEAKSRADKLVILVGSADQPRTFKNPFTFDERFDIIHNAMADIGFSPGDIFKTCVRPIIDTRYDDDAWLIRVQNTINEIAEGDVAIIGSAKDEHTSEYLKMFPQWDLIDIPHETIMNATDIRNLYFDEGMNNDYLKAVVPLATFEILEAFTKTDEYRRLVEEKKFVDQYIKRKEVYEYPIIAVTVDSVVIQSGHVLLIKRRSIPGKGLWALPGGYFDAVKDRTPIDGIMRELKEETKIDVPEKVLRGSVRQILPFSAPDRSLLGRSITFAAHIVLAGGEWKLPKVKGEDDAEKAKWVPLSEVRRDMLFDDHFDIIQHYVPSIG